MAAFDVLLQGGTLIDGSGAPGVRADVGILGDRILAVGDLSPVDPDGVGLVLDVTGRVVTPGFIDPHGHSDGSLFLDGALASHLHQGFTTQLSGNCGDTPRADHRRRARRSSTCRSGRTSSRRAGRPSGSTSIGSPSNRSVRTSRSSSATARSAGPSSVPTPGRRPPTSWRRWSARSTARWTRVRWVSRPA